MNTFRLSTALRAGLQAAGLDPALALRRAGLPLTLWSSEGGMVTTGQFFALFRGLESLSGDPSLGLRLPALAPVESHHPASILAYHARTFRDGLQRLARYKILCCQEEMLFTESHGECRLEFNWLDAPEAPPPLLIDCVFMAALEMGRRGTRKPLRPLRVELKRSAEHQALYEGAYGCRVKCRSRRDAIFFRAGDLDLPFVTYNAELLDMLTPQLDRQLAQRRKQQTCSEKVNWVLKRLLGGPRPEIGDVARELGMSSRTLQRRITGEGASFRKLLNDARRELARFYLREPSLGVNEIAYLLSYEEPSSFFRAFHEWEGKPPRRWRIAQRRMIAPVSRLPSIPS
jgi:AraC-like DNA-binding protein